MRLVRPLQSCDYTIRHFYSSEDESSNYTLQQLWDMKDLKLDPECLPYKSIKTQFGEMLMRIDTFKTQRFLLKYVGRHFVFINNNERRVIPICSHSQ